MLILICVFVDKQHISSFKSDGDPIQYCFNHIWIIIEVVHVDNNYETKAFSHFNFFVVYHRKVFLFLLYILRDLVLHAVNNNHEFDCLIVYKNIRMGGENFKRKETLLLGRLLLSLLNIKIQKWKQTFFIFISPALLPYPRSSSHPTNMNRILKVSLQLLHPRHAPSVQVSLKCITSHTFKYLHKQFISNAPSSHQNHLHPHQQLFDPIIV